MAKTFMLFASGTQANMVSSWTNELHCSILKDGSISLRACVCVDGQGDYGGRNWFPSRRGIKSPKQFVDAYFSFVDEIDTDIWSIKDDLLPVLYKHAPLFACLTNLYIEIDANQTEKDLEFFFLCQKVILFADLSLPEDFKSAAELIENTYNFVKQHFHSTGQLPAGQHALMGTSISFPSKAIRKNKEYLEFKREQALEAHVRCADWELEQTRLRGFAMSNQYQRVSDFCRNYFEQHKKLPVGNHKIGQTEVTFNCKD